LVCRIGTHDLDTIKGPFTYEALPPKDINFTPLNQTKQINGEELMSFYETDRHLGRYLHILRDQPLYPVILDADRNICSLPPIINSERSKITLDTKNVFIDMTATDQTKLDIVCNIMVAMFSKYCAEPFTIEPVKVVSEHNGTTRVTPSLATRTLEVEVDYLNEVCGLEESPESISKLLSKMAYAAEPTNNPKLIKVTVPPTRADVLHQCDVVSLGASALLLNCQLTLP
jgi:phenylalanyl-tRNA synthetase beta chain